MTPGSLRWPFTHRPNGVLADNGLVPALIEWHSTVRLASTMRQSGCSMIRIEALNPERDRLRERHESLGLDDALSISTLSVTVTPHLVARIDTPTGLRSLGWSSKQQVGHPKSSTGAS